MRKSNIALACAMAAGLGGHAAAETSFDRAVATLKSVNAISFTTVRMGGSEVEGKMFVGGDLSGNTFQVGFGNSRQGQSASAFPILTVGGSVSNGVVNFYNSAIPGGTVGGGAPSLVVKGNVNKIDFHGADGVSVKIGGNYGGDVLNTPRGGRISVGGNVAGQVVTAGGATLDVGGNVARNVNGAAGATVRINGTVAGVDGTSGFSLTAGGRNGGNYNLNGATVSFGPKSAVLPAIDIASQTAQIKSDMIGLSSYIRAINGSQTTVLTIDGATVDMGTPIRFGTLKNDNVVLNIADGGAFFAKGGDLATLLSELPVAGGVTKTLMINVGGVNITQNVNLNYDAGGNGPNFNQYLIWNFYEARSVSLKGFHGTVLAPYATLSNSSAIEGSIVANAMELNGEIHLGTLAIRAAVPETSTWIALTIGFGAIGGAMRRSRRMERTRRAA